MTIKTVEFVEIEREIRKTKKPVLDILASELGKAYVIAITRDGCPDCEEQKPLLDKLTVKMAQKNGDKVVFVRIHVKYSQDFTEESLRSKDVFHHYFYPTNLILIKTRDRGAFEAYRFINPEMDELEKYSESALKTATMLAKED
jgi:thiol-disulfide isomerase/thioredoxin